MKPVNVLNEINVNTVCQNMIEPFRTTLGLTTGTCGSRCTKELCPCLFSSLWRPSGRVCRYIQNTEQWQTNNDAALLKLYALCVSVFAGEPGQRSQNFPELLLSVETVWGPAWVLQHPSGLHCGQERRIPTETGSVRTSTSTYQSTVGFI